MDMPLGQFQSKIANIYWKKRNLVKLRLRKFVIKPRTENYKTQTKVYKQPPEVHKTRKEFFLRTRHSSISSINQYKTNSIKATRKANVLLKP
jgi:hypothetical protein